MDSRRDFTSKKVFSGYFSELGEKANSALGVLERAPSAKLRRLGDGAAQDVFQRYLKLCGSVGVMSLRVFSPPPRATSRPHSLVRI